MPFTVIGGTFHLVGKGSNGKDSGFEPDGDSIQFRPTDPGLLDRLERNGKPYRLTPIGSTQLRFEGIDALELHYGGSHQPRPLADEGRDALTGALDLNPVPYVMPSGIRVRPPCERDKTPGFILSRALEAHGRPVAFAFKGQPPEPDGSEVFLKAGHLRKSLNYKALAGGNAYPLYYDTLFAELRTAFTAAAGSARDAGKGIWSRDVSTKGLAIGTQADLERDGVVFPKLFRRLTEYIKVHPNDPGGFPGWLDDKWEQVLDTTTGNFTHLDDVIETKANKVKMLRGPEELVFVSAKTTSRAVAPWLAV